MVQNGAATSFAALDEQRRAEAMARFVVLRPHLEEGVPLVRAAGEAGVPVRTAERWLARYRQGGLPNLARPNRHDAGTRQLPLDLLALVEGMALNGQNRPPPPSTAGSAPPRQYRAGASRPTAPSTRSLLPSTPA